MVYSAETTRRFAAPTASGELEGAAVQRGAAGRLEDGTWVQFAVRVDFSSAGSRIAEARFRAFGCPHVIAAADLLCELAAGQQVADEPLLPAADLRRRLDAPTDKLGRLLIVEDAWIAAMRAAVSKSA